MWPLCTANSILWLLIPLLIGFIAGWWAWAGRNRGRADHRRPIQRSNGVALAAAPAATKDIWAEPARADAPAVVPLRAQADGDDVAVAQPAPGDADAGSYPEATPEPGLPPRGGADAIGIAPAVGEPDDLQQISGIGPKLNELLNYLGVRRFDQIAAWNADDVAKVDAHLGAFRGRIERDNWIAQARRLARP